MIVGSAMALTTLDPEIVRRVTGILHKREAMVVDLIRQGQADGSIPARIDVKATARLMLCLLQGMRVVGKTGRIRADMTAVVDTAMKLLE